MTLSQTREKRGLGGRVLAKLLTPCLRRAIFLSSLAAFLNNTREADKELECKLTQLFDLAYEPSTLRFPMQLHHRIWTDIENPFTKDKTDFSAMNKFAEDVLAKTPHWLVYDISRTIRSDIFKLLRSQMPA